MLQVETFDEVFMLTVEDIAVYECPLCKRQVTDFAKNFFFQDGLDTCKGIKELQDEAQFMKLQDDVPF